MFTKHALFLLDTKFYSIVLMFSFEKNMFLYMGCLLSRSIGCLAFSERVPGLIPSQAASKKPRYLVSVSVSVKCDGLM